MAATAVATVAGGTVALAYPPPGSTANSSPTNSTTSPGSNDTVTMQVLNPDGTPASGQTINWSLSGPTALVQDGIVLVASTSASVSPTTSTTDSSGRASTVFNSGTQCGRFTITGDAGGGVSAQTQVNVLCTAGSTSGGGTGLPNGAAIVPVSERAAWILPAIIAGMVGLLGAVGYAGTLIVRRRTA